MVTLGGVWELQSAKLSDKSQEFDSCLWFGSGNQNTYFKVWEKLSCCKDRHEIMDNSGPCTHILLIKFGCIMCCDTRL